MELSIIIVNYRSRKYIDRCILSAESFLNDIPHEIIIINNDEEKLELSTRNARVSIIENNSNCGFGTANNIGANKAQGKIFWFLNPDTEIISFDYELVKKLFSDKTIGIIGTRMLTEKEEVQPWSAGYAVTPWSIIKSNIGLDKSNFVWNSPSRKGADWVSGGSFLIPKPLFQELDGFDEAFFMYFEDIDLCRRVKALDKKILLEPNIKILHWCGKSAENKKLQKKQYYRSQDQYLRKHFGRLPQTCIQALRLLCS